MTTYLLASRYDAYLSLRSEKRNSLSAADKSSLPSPVASRLVGAVVVFCSPPSKLRSPGSSPQNSLALYSRQSGRLPSDRRLKGQPPPGSCFSDQTLSGRSCSGLFSLSLLLLVVRFWRFCCSCSLSSSFLSFGFPRNVPNRTASRYVKNIQERICFFNVSYRKNTFLKKIPHNPLAQNGKCFSQISTHK